MSFDHTTALTEIANGDASALQCLNTFFEWFHAFDDAVDHDKPYPLSWIVLSNLNALKCAAKNSFFQKHMDELFPVMQAGALAYAESERFKNHESPLHRIASQVLKSQYQDLFFAVARITGGDAHMVAMSEKYRDFDFDPTPAP